MLVRYRGHADRESRAPRWQYLGRDKEVMLPLPQHDGESLVVDYVAAPGDLDVLLVPMRAQLSDEGMFLYSGSNKRVEVDPEKSPVYLAASQELPGRFIGPPRFGLLICNPSGATVVAHGYIADVYAEVVGSEDE